MNGTVYWYVDLLYYLITIGIPWFVIRKCEKQMRELSDPT